MLDGRSELSVDTVDSVNELHEIKLLLFYRLGLTINCRPVYRSCLALLDQ